MIQQFFTDAFKGKTICLLGFGREGKSTYLALNRYLSSSKIFISDSNAETSQRFISEFGKPDNVTLFCGDNYQQAFAQSEVIFKSPGVSPKSLQKDGAGTDMVFTSQTAVFLEMFRRQIIGVTGTKGKSTTVSLLHHIFSVANRNVLLAGNIGIPPFELLDKIQEETIVIYEMSSHQLENLNISPGTSILLNIFQEHLDHYASYKDYQLAKMNIARWQMPGDVFIYNNASELLRELVCTAAGDGEHYAIHGSPTDRGAWCEGNDLIIRSNEERICIDNLCEDRRLPGRHNLINIAAATLAAHIWGVNADAVKRAVASFEGLAHRLEFVREWQGVKYYNDSISTIPESTIEALKTFPGVETLLLGGFDRGVDYGVLTGYLTQNPVPKLILIGKAGQRIYEELEKQPGKSTTECFLFHDFEAAVEKAVKLGTPGGICLLSPAAASYDMFRNFEERGEKFRQIINRSDK